ncbi:MAG: glycosyltransferase family 2 protein [Bacteroidota bacterium]
MTIDIISVLYNSNKWLQGYLNSLQNLDYDLKCIHLIWVDNNPGSTDINSAQNHPIIKKIGNFTYIKNDANLGFGVANNIGVRSGKNPFVFFLNIDTELTPESLNELKKEIEMASPETAAWEFRQFPYEHPKYYNPVSRKVSWASGAALVVKRNVFDLIGGFDENIFMYAEDVDLSWHLRSLGYAIIYCPKCVVYHHSYDEEDEVKPTQFYYSIINHLMLRYKYGSILQVIDCYKIIYSIINSKQPVLKDQGIKLRSLLKGSVKKGLIFRKSRPKLADKTFKPNFIGLDYELIRKGAFFKNERWQDLPEKPLVSIIVRTHKRPLVLEEAIKSIINQTYSNIEIIVIEDGKNTAASLIEKYQKKANIQYFYTNEQKGRSFAGNLGMLKAKGKYLTFLDDDDLIFADHIEILIIEALKSGSDLVHSPAFCVSTDIRSNNPYVYKEYSFEIKHDFAAEKDELLNNNLFPIQAVLFKKELFEKHGGFDENIEYLEDWALWLKYVLPSNISYADKLTSLYRVPANSKQYKTRLSQLMSTRDYVLAKYANNYFMEKQAFKLAVESIKDLKPINPDRVSKYIDLIIYGYNCMSIYGWGVVDRNDNFDKLFLKVNILGNTLYYKINLDFRRDIQRKFNSKNRKLGFKGEFQILGLKGKFVPVTLIMVKGNEYYEYHVSWFSIQRNIFMNYLRRLYRGMY